MKIRLLIFCLLAFLVTDAFSQQKEFPVLKGSYLGQKPPGIMPQVFAPGIISTKDNIEFANIGNSFLSLIQIPHYFS